MALKSLIKAIQFVAVLPILFFAKPGLCQEKHLIELQPSIFIIPDRTFYIDSVIDNRSNKESIGVVQKGANMVQVSADLTGGFTNSLQNYFKTVVGKAHSKQRRLIAVFDEFNILEKTYRFKETGYADMEISFCELDSGKLRKFYTCTDHQESGGLDVTGSHLRRINSCLASCLKKLATATPESTSHREYLTLGQQWMPYDSNSILVAPVLKKGIYKNYKELRTNSPSIMTEFKIIPQYGYIELRTLTSDKRINEAFGFSDGKDIYINTFFYNKGNAKAHYAQVIEKGRYFVWLDHYLAPGDAAAIGLAFGPFGTAIASNGFDCISLDLKNGLIIPLNEKTLSIILAHDPELLQEMKASKKLSIADQLKLVKAYNSKHLRLKGTE
ncbi:MAG: hypothetical protein HY015_04955 [Bacteroidetes bacterium]|nr:hypothetical protein [Bacteroidota bacterium]MBI3482310.1 hypothetical protein [Bacteroidota bacterium]